MANPMFNEAAFERARAQAPEGFIPRRAVSNRVMTLQGTINKTFILLALCVAGGYIGWIKAATLYTAVWPLLLVAFGLAIWTSFKPSVSAVTAPLYALAEGGLLGVISAAYNMRYQGIVLNAVLITVLVFAVMLFLYKTQIIRVTQKFATAVTSATLAICIMYGISLLLSLFGVSISYLVSSSPLSIAISVIVCVVAAFNLMLDFQFIAGMSAQGNAPKYMEWYGGFGLLVTIVWLYIEILNLLGKLNDRR